MLLADIQKIITPDVWKSIEEGRSYRFNVTTDFYIEGIENYYDHYYLRLRDGRRVSVPRARDYIDFCERLLIVWAEYLGDGLQAKSDTPSLNEEYGYETDIKETEHWYCRGCGKEFSHEMHFRKDGFGRNVCPYCDHRMLEVHNGTLDSFYD